MEGIIRNTFYRILGVEQQSGVLKRALQRGYWVKSQGIDGNTEEYLRPNFDGTWNNNTTWHDRVVGIVHANTVGLGRGALTVEEFGAYDDEEILEQLSTVFKGCKMRYKRQKEEEEEEEKTHGDKDNRCDGRKSRVSDILLRVLKLLHYIKLCRKLPLGGMCADLYLKLPTVI
jgi:hypothetical protein